jgi:3-(3-hydroxy-phenyl)propionate hydroxylase
VNTAVNAVANNPPATSGYELPVYPFVAPQAVASGQVEHVTVVIVGAGLCGLTLACDLASRGIKSVVLDDDNTVGVRGASSRGIVYAQKTLEVMDRLGIYERIAKKGVRWSVGKTLAGNEVVYEFDAATTSDSRQPPFVNLQQFYLEWFLVERVMELGLTDLRWKNKVTAFSQDAERAHLQIETPAGSYALEADYVLDCSGVHSFIRESLKLPVHPAKGIDRWCISDVRFKAPLPIERWTWVEAPFNDNRAVWQHLMADDVWRLDFQMDPSCDLDYVSRADVAAERVRKQVGDDVEFELVWVGPYTYRSQLLDDFRAGRTFFLGDAAHVMSPFGARGGNSAIQDADNLGWKLAQVLRGVAPAALLDSYSTERRAAAQFNIMTTRRTSRFLSPETPAEKIFRDAALTLARKHPFARSLVNTGRLSTSYIYGKPPTSAAQRHAASAGPGQAVQNVEIILPDGRRSPLARLFQGNASEILIWTGSSGHLRDEVIRFANREAPHARMLELDSRALGLSGIKDVGGRLARQLGFARGETACAVIRPDMVMAACVQAPTVARVAAALKASRAGKLQ